MASSNSDSVDFEYFRYDPSLAAAIVFIVAFTFTSTFHVYQMISTRTWYLIPLVIGGSCQYRCIDLKIETDKGSSQSKLWGISGELYAQNKHRTIP